MSQKEYAEVKKKEAQKELERQAGIAAVAEKFAKLSEHPLSNGHKLTEWAELAYDMGQKYGVDPILIGAVIYHESNGGDPLANANSSKGRGGGGGAGKGLMQIEFSIHGHNFGDTEEEQLKNVYDPIQNVDYGVRYLSGFLHSYGSVQHALTAYNLGPGGLEDVLVIQQQQGVRFERAVEIRNKNTGQGSPSYARDVLYLYGLMQGG
ncbi:MAG: lytic transglycosylase [Symbiobacteriaceae bacterium]|jgi:soluble lytic murein transglycosylase-like protein|nr:lytic transglycosylase [Symbiobacteriaceae bacterium]